MQNTIILTIQTVGLTEGDLNTLADDLMVAVMAVTNAAEYEGEEAMTADSECLIVPPAGVYVATNAPEAYDYGWTTQVDVQSIGRFPELRVVVIPSKHVDYQIGRYQSGLYVTFTGDSCEAVYTQARNF